MKKSLKLVVVGAGLIGKRHIETILQCDGVELFAIVDPGKAAAEYAVAINTVHYTTLEEFFASNLAKNNKPDGIIVATPNNSHLPIGLECIKNKCPVLMEKPIAVTAIEGLQLVSAAKKVGVPLLVGHHRLHNPLIKVAHETISAGKLGKLRAVHINCWLYKPSEYFDESPWRKEKGAGPVAENLVHDVYLVMYLCGEVVSVHAIAANSSRGYQNEDVATAILQFKSGALGTLSVSDTIVAPWSWELTARENPAYPPTDQSCYLIGGTKGSLSLPDLKIWKNGGKRSWLQPIQSTSLIRSFSDPLANQIIQFSNVIRGKEEPLVSGEDGLRTLEVLEGIKKSVETLKTIYI